MQKIDIEDYIPAGYENRISRAELSTRTGLPDRANRQLIEEARERMILIISADGGYFLYKDARDDSYARAYMKSEENRFRAMSHKKRLLRSAWSRVHPEEKRGQFPGQMSMF